MDPLPKLPVEFLEVNYDVSEPPVKAMDNAQVSVSFSLRRKDQPLTAIDKMKAPLPFAISEIFWANVVSANCVTFGDDVKKVYDLVLDMKGFSHELMPGDTIAICPRNNSEQVDKLLSRLGVKEHMNISCQISIKRDCEKKKVPVHIPQNSTLQEIFESCLDLQAVPKKLFLRALLEYTSDPKDHESLSSLCSRKSDKYSEWIASGRSYLEALLIDHPSCLPPINVVLEHMPRLLPRPYSIAFLSGDANTHVHVAFSVIQFYVAGVKKTGVCTGWLESVTSKLRTAGDSTGDTASALCNQVASLNISGGEKPQVKVPLFLRASNGFHAPADLSRPLIMVGPGVGVAPFVGFLQQRELHLKDANLVKVNQCWLFYGCRYSHRDMLYSEEIKRHLSNGTLDKYILAHSRDRSAPKYVQDNIRLYSQDVCQMLLEEDAYFFVCGDASNMARDVLAVVVNSIAKYKGVNKVDAQKIVMELQAAGRYREDVWTIQDDVFRMYSKAMADDKKRQVMNAIVPPERRLVVCDMV